MLGARTRCEMNDQAEGPQTDLVGEDLDEPAGKTLKSRLCYQKLVLRNLGINAAVFQLTFLYF